MLSQSYFVTRNVLKNGLNLGTVEPACMVSVLSNENLPYEGARLTLYPGYSLV